MSPAEVQVVSTGTANVASVLVGLRRVGASPRLVERARDIEEARAVVVPGVGSFAAALEGLRSRGLAEAIRERVEAGRPTLLICLGLQILGDTSEEDPGVPGLGVAPVAARRFPDAVTTPQLGWNRVEPHADCRWVREGFAYYANSFRFVEAPAGWAAARSVHGGPFIASLERGSVLACQFHPELSGDWGSDLLSRWVREADGVGADPREGERSC